MVYELNEDTPVCDLTLTGPIVVEPSEDALFDRLGDALVRASLLAVKDRGVFHLALSGGSTPEPFYMRLCTDPRYRVIPWAQTHLWIVDERRVGEEDDRLNFRMIRQALADHVPMRARQLHAMPVLHEDAADRYEGELRRLVPDGRLDFVLLGMGDDGHTASLFPGSPGLAVQDRWIVANDGPQVTPPPRLTMTYPLLNAARSLAVLATRAKKAAMLRQLDQQVRDGRLDHGKYPILGVCPAEGILTWYLDAAAANGQ